MSESGFEFNSENCIQCHACEAACKSYRQLENGVKWRRVYNLWHGAYPDTRISTLSVSCMHCANPACVEACPSGAISKRAEDGLVLCDSVLCTGCRICFGACPVGAPQYGADGKMQKCDYCTVCTQPGDGVAACVRVCPTQALEQVQMSAAQKAETEKTVAAKLECQTR